MVNLADRDLITRLNGKLNLLIAAEVGFDDGQSLPGAKEAYNQLTL